MGGALSAFMSNVFLTNMESQILPDFINSAEIVSYQRYIDDVLVVCKKSSFEKLTQKFNNFDPKLKWKPEIMENGKIRFLDMNFTLENKNFAFPIILNLPINHKFQIGAPLSQQKVQKFRIFAVHYTD